MSRLNLSVPHVLETYFPGVKFDTLSTPVSSTIVSCEGSTAVDLKWKLTITEPADGICFNFYRVWDGPAMVHHAPTGFVLRSNGGLTVVYQNNSQRNGTMLCKYLHVFTEEELKDHIDRILVRGESYSAM